MLTKGLYYINLYSKEKYATPTVLSLTNMLLFFTVSIVLIIIMTIYYSFGKEGLQNSIAGARAKYKVSTLKLETSMELQNQLSQDISAEREITQLEVGVQERLLHIKTLELVASGNSEGFSAMMESLARQWREGMWIKNLEYINGGESVNLSGKAIQAQEVSSFLQRLGKEDVYANTTFENVSISVNESEEGAALDFSLSSKSLGDDVQQSEQQVPSGFENFLSGAGVTPEALEGVGKVMENMQRFTDQ